MPSLLSDLSLPHWHTLTTALIGVCSASLALLVGFILVGRRRAKAPPKLKEEPTPNRDIFVHGSTNEKRVSLRRRGSPMAVLITDEEAVAVPIEGLVVDRSMGGLCLRVTRKPIEVGSILSVRPAKAASGIPWVQLEVKSCREDDDEWELGCQFRKVPPWNILLQFG